MKKYLIITALLLCVALAFPFIWNSCIADNPKNTVTHIDVKDWNSAVPPIISALMSLLVIFQAEKQRETSEKAQERMERINEKMLDTERRGKIGYFVPIVNESLPTGKEIRVRHPLKQYIYLRCLGGNGVFASQNSLSVCGIEKEIPQHEPLWFSSDDSFNEMNFECFLTDEELNYPELNIFISFSLTNILGYKYKQELEIGFENKSGYGTVSSFNMRLLEAEQNAD